MLSLDNEPTRDNNALLYALEQGRQALLRAQQEHQQAKQQQHQQQQSNQRLPWTLFAGLPGLQEDDAPEKLKQDQQLNSIPYMLMQQQQQQHQDQNTKITDDELRVALMLGNNVLGNGSSPIHQSMNSLMRAESRSASAPNLFASYNLSPQLGAEHSLNSHQNFPATAKAPLMSALSLLSGPDSLGRSSSLGTTPVSSPLATPDSPSSALPRGGSHPNLSMYSSQDPCTALAELEKRAALKRPTLGPKKHSSSSTGSGSTMNNKSRAYASWRDSERDEVVRALLGIVLQNPDVKWHGGRRQDLVAISSTMQSKTRSQCRDFYYRCLKQITKLLNSTGIKVDLAADCDLARAAIVFYLQHYRLANEGTETRHLTFTARDQAMRYLNSNLTRAVTKYMGLNKEQRKEMLVTACVEHLRKQTPSSSV